MIKTILASVGMVALVIIVWQEYVYKEVADTPQLSICTGNFALCAASTCEPTGKTMTTNDGNTYPEMLCTCPVLNGASIAELTMGQMQGTCDVADPEKDVWSLFAPKVFYPQASNDFVQEPKSATKASVQSCSGDVAPESVNCFGMPCTYEPELINGTLVASCRCPSRQIDKGTEFLIEAGQGDPSYCLKHPVSAPDPLTDLILNMGE
jgi:hypothetical protein